MLLGQGLRLHQPDRLIARIRGLLLRPWAGWFLKPWLCKWSHSRGWTGCGTLIQWGALHRRLASNVWCRCWLRRRPSWRGFRLIGPYLICPSRSILSFRGGAGFPALLGGLVRDHSPRPGFDSRIYGLWRFSRLRWPPGVSGVIWTPGTQTNGCSPTFVRVVAVVIGPSSRSPRRGRWRRGLRPRRLSRLLAPPEELSGLPLALASTPSRVLYGGSRAPSCPFYAFRALGTVIAALGRGLPRALLALGRFLSFGLAGTLALCSTDLCLALTFGASITFRPGCTTASGSLMPVAFVTVIMGWLRGPGPTRAILSRKPRGLIQITERRLPQNKA